MGVAEKQTRRVRILDEDRSARGRLKVVCVDGKSTRIIPFNSTNFVRFDLTPEQIEKENLGIPFRLEYSTAEKRRRVARKLAKVKRLSDLEAIAAEEQRQKGERRKFADYEDDTLTPEDIADMVPCLIRKSSVNTCTSGEEATTSNTKGDGDAKEDWRGEWAEGAYRAKAKCKPRENFFPDVDPDIWFGLISGERLYTP